MTDLDEAPDVNPLSGYVEVTLPGDSKPLPRLRASGLPRQYSPKVAGYARGPFLDPQLVTPSAWRWRNCRTYIIRHTDGQDYRAVRVLETSHTPEFVGYWAVERLGVPLTELEVK